VIGDAVARIEFEFSGNRLHVGSAWGVIRVRGC